MLLYRLLLTLISPAFAVILAVRVLRGTESQVMLRMRLGGGPARPAGPALWLHGASNGELTAARHMIRQMQARWPDHHLIVTCNTPSALHMVQGWDMPGVHVCLAPLDFRWTVKRFLKGLQVRAFCQLEGDFWPGRIACLQSRGIPCALLSGRISEKSANAWARIPGLSRNVFGAWDLTFAQDAASEARLRALGVPPESIAPQIRLKDSYDAADHRPPERHVPFARSDVWLAASTHAGEDAPLLQAHLAARKTHPALRMILAPRHPKRGPQAAQMATALGLRVARLSGGDPITPETDVIVADTLGEMATWYQASFACFVAGSLVDKGGHTPFEPIAHDCAVIHGPHLSNFASSYARLNEAQATIAVEDPDQIAAALISLTRSEVRRVQTRRAKDCVTAHKSSQPESADILKRLDPLVNR